MHNVIKWWHNVLRMVWQSLLPIRAKLFLWRAMIGRWPLGRCIQEEKYFMSTMLLEYNTNHFITCEASQYVWTYVCGCVVLDSINVGSKRPLLQIQIYFHFREILGRVIAYMV